MTRGEEIQAKTEELYGGVNKSFPISEFVNEEKRNCFKAGAEWADETMINKACDLYRKELQQMQRLITLIRRNAANLLDIDGSVAAFRKAMEG